MERGTLIHYGCATFPPGRFSSEEIPKHPANSGARGRPKRPRAHFLWGVRMDGRLSQAACDHDPESSRNAVRAFAPLRAHTTATDPGGLKTESSATARFTHSNRQTTHGPSLSRGRPSALSRTFLRALLPSPGRIRRWLGRVDCSGPHSGIALEYTIKLPSRPSSRNEWSVATMPRSLTKIVLVIFTALLRRAVASRMKTKS